MLLLQYGEVPTQLASIRTNVKTMLTQYGSISYA